MEASFELTIVAYLRTAGGRVRVLLAVDRDGERLFDGDPALLAEHRPGAAPERMQLEGADRLCDDAVSEVRERVHVQLAALLDAAFDERGELDADRLLGRALLVSARADLFDA